MLKRAPAVDLGPEGILASIEDYRGLMVDLDNSRSVPPHTFADVRYTLARKLDESGLKAGDRVIVAAGNGPMFIAAWAAILMRGGSPLLVHWETPPAELHRIALRHHARFVASDSQQPPSLEAVGASAKAIDCGHGFEIVWADFGGSAEPEDGAYLTLRGVPLHPTSGTTGQSKLAVRPVAAAVAEAVNYQQTIGIDDHDRILAVAPMSHAYGHGWYVITPITTGADVLTIRRFNAKMVVDACRECGITILPAVGAILDTLLFGACDGLFDPTRRVFTGGAPVSERTASSFLKVAGTRPRPLFGTTETGGIAVAGPLDEGGIRGRVGPLFKNVEISIRPPEDGGDLGKGIGLVNVRSGSVMSGYLVDEQLDTSILSDGWFNTGDLGSFDGEGALHLRGRQAEVVNVSGMKVLPSEVEDVIASLPGVKEVKVYSRKSRAGAFHVRAAVVVNEGVDVSQIKAFCKEQLVFYKRPSRITLLDALPRSTAGKIDSSRLP
jgi:acyl-CoA synthetase (AMP-forming)/AMP-acid ligase II